MGDIIKTFLYFIKKNKILLIFFPIYIIYILIVYIGLGVGDDIWDNSMKSIKKSK